MKLSEVLSPDHVTSSLSGGSVHATAAALLARFPSLMHSSDLARVRERLDSLSSEDIVVIADRAFIVHFRSDVVSQVTLLAGSTTDPVCREPSDSDQQCARLITLLLAPAKKAAEHLQLLGAVGRLLSRSGVAEEIVRLAGTPELAAFLESVDFELPAQLRVRDIMNPRPHTAAPDAALRDAARAMLRSGTGGVIVVDSDMRIVGQLGEKELMRDLLTNYLQGDTAQRDAPGSTGRRRVRDVMTRQVLGVSPDLPLSEVASIMVNKDVERVPVVADGVLVGVLGRADIVRKLIGY